VACYNPASVVRIFAAAARSGLLAQRINVSACCANINAAALDLHRTSRNVIYAPGMIYRFYLEHPASVNRRCIALFTQRHRGPAQHRAWRNGSRHRGSFAAAKQRHQKMTLARGVWCKWRNRVTFSAPLDSPAAWFSRMRVTWWRKRQLWREKRKDSAVRWHRQKVISAKNKKQHNALSRAWRQHQKWRRRVSRRRRAPWRIALRVASR